MPKRINRIRGILKPMLATRSWNDAAHEISSAESKRIIFCRAEGRAAEAGVVLPKRRVVLPKRSGFRRGDPKKKKKKAGITVSRRKANCSGLEMTKDRACQALESPFVIHQLGKHPVLYYNEARFSLFRPNFRDFQAILRG